MKIGLKEIVGPFLFFTLWGFMVIHSTWALMNMVKEPYGVTNVYFGITTQSFHSYTIVSLSAVFSILCFYFFRGILSLRHIFISIALSIFPLIHYEFWFHLGMWIVWGDYKPRFWGLYTLLILVCIYYLHKRWNILNLKRYNILTYIGIYMVFLFLWWQLIDTGFYIKFAQWYRGEIPTNPVGLLNGVGKSLGLFMWLPLVRRVRKQ